MPLSLRWILCDPGWKKVYDKLIASKKPNVQDSLDIWYPGIIRRRIQQISTKFPQGFVSSNDNSVHADLSIGVRFDLAQLELNRHRIRLSSLRKIKEALSRRSHGSEMFLYKNMSTISFLEPEGCKTNPTNIEDILMAAQKANKESFPRKRRNSSITLDILSSSWNSKNMDDTLSFLKASTLGSSKNSLGDSHSFLKSSTRTFGSSKNCDESFFSLDEDGLSSEASRLQRKSSASTIGSLKNCIIEFDEESYCSVQNLEENSTDCKTSEAPQPRRKSRNERTVSWKSDLISDGITHANNQNVNNIDGEIYGNCGRDDVSSRGVHIIGTMSPKSEPVENSMVAHDNDYSTNHINEAIDNNKENSKEDEIPQSPKPQGQKRRRKLPMIFRCFRWRKSTMTTGK